MKETSANSGFQPEIQDDGQLYRQLIENSLEAVTLNQHGRFLLVNNAFCEMFGYTKAEVMELDPPSILAPEERAHIVDLHFKRMKGELNTLHYTARFIHKSGRRILAELNATTVRVNGQNASFVSIRDVTEREQMERALRESEAKYKTLVENSHDGILIVRDDKIFFANNTVCNMLGYTAGELMSASAIGNIHPDDRYKIRNIAERRRNHDFSTIAESFRMIDKSGEVRVCETISTLIEFNGQWASFFTVHDITERIRHEEEIARSEQKYRELAEMLPITVYELDANGMPTYMNRAGLKMFGTEEGLVTDYPASSYFLPVQQPTMESKLRSLQVDRPGNGSYPVAAEPVEYTLVRTDGNQIPVMIYSTSIIDNGVFKGSRGIIVDISEQKFMENALRESEEKYKALIENSQDGIFALIDDKIIFANNTISKMLEYTQSELYRLSAFDLIDGRDMSKARKFSEIRRKGHKGTLNGIFRFKTKSGNIKDVDVYSSVLELSGKVVSYITVHDLTEKRKMQEALVKSEQKYRELADFMPQTLFELDHELRLIYMNKSGMDIFGLTEADYGTNSLDHFVESDRPIVANNLKIILKGRTREMVYEYVAQNAEGKCIPILTYSLPVFKNGEVVGVRGMVIDISERKAAEQALRESEQKYRELAEMLPQTVFEINQQGKLRYLNKTGIEKFGLNYRDICVFDLVVPEDLDRMRQNFTNVSVNKMPAKGNIYTLKGVDGSLFPAMISASPMSVDGKPDGSRGVVIDLSDHIAMQKALAESEEKYRSLIENAMDGIVIAQEGTLKFANQAVCELMGYSMEELIGIPYARFVVKPDENLLSESEIAEFTSRNFRGMFRTRLIRKDGKIITVELNARTLVYNEKPAVFIIIRDITERILIENELQVAKTELEKLNSQLEKRVKESSKRLTEARTQLINLQKENLQSQYDVLKQQVNPHFLFNSLNVLTSLIKLDPDLAERFSEQLSKVYRYVLENKDNELIDVSTELNFLDAYIFLLNIRFVDKLDIRLDISESRRNDKIIPLAMQLLIENAIKHNTMSKNNPLRIEIFVDEENYLNVINNLQERPSQIVSTGVGLKNILNRYHLLGLPLPVFEKNSGQFVAKIPLVKNG